LERETMLAIEASMVARVTTPVAEEGYTTTTWKDSKAEGEEKV
jgi:hypothetical protein